MAKVPEARVTHAVFFFLGSTATMVAVLLLHYSAEFISPWPVGVSSWRSASATRAAHQINITNPPPTFEEEHEKFAGLAAMVEQVAMEDKTVIVTCVNQAWAAPGSLLDLFLESFHIGEDIGHLLRHLLIVAMDPMAFDRCKQLHRHCYLFSAVKGINFTSEKMFMSKEYIALVGSKLLLQQRVLELGYNYLFTDVDVMWFRNPMKHVTVYADISTSSDLFFGNPDNIDNFPNTGFVYVKPNNRTIEMTKYWHASKDKYPDLHEQNVFNKIKKDLVNRLHVKVQYIDTNYLGGFCNYGKDLNKICTMHANCCVGLRAKLHDLRIVLDDWKNYTRLPDSDKNNNQVAKWTVPGNCIH